MSHETTDMLSVNSWWCTRCNTSGMGSIAEHLRVVHGETPNFATVPSWPTREEVRGVRLGDLYRDKQGDVWEVVALVTDPEAVVRKLATGEKEHHVIGCLNWQEKWREGPLRAGKSDSQQEGT